MIDEHARLFAGVSTTGIPELRTVVATPCNQIDPIEAKFLTPYTPSGEVTWFEGDSKIGKTTVGVDLISRLSRGDIWVDGSPLPRERSAIITCEDDVARTIVPRLIAARADLSRVDVLQANDADGHDSTITFLRDLPGIARQLRDRKTKLLLVDGTFGLLGVQDGNSYADAYRYMLPAVEMVRDLDVATIFVRHVRKSDASALHRGVGSVGYTALGRSTVSFAADRDDATRCVMAHAGCNVGPTAPSLYYKIVPGAVVPGFVRSVGAIEWGGVADVTADEALASRAPSDRSEIEIAEDWIRENLDDNPRSSTELRGAAEKAGISARTLQRAAHRLGVKMCKGNRHSLGTWAFEAPSNSSGGSRDFRGDRGATNVDVSTFSGSAQEAPNYTRQHVSEANGASTGAFL